MHFKTNVKGFAVSFQKFQRLVKIKRVERSTLANRLQFVIGAYLVPESD
jgi:hypothetical protein